MTDKDVEQLTGPKPEALRRALHRMSDDLHVTEHKPAAVWSQQLGRWVTLPEAEDEGATNE